MIHLFTAIFKMSITASYVAVAVIIIRMFLKKAPKVFSYILWSAVLIRLVCPVTFDSNFSFLGFLQARTKAGVYTTAIDTASYALLDTGAVQNTSAGSGMDNTVNTLLPSAMQIESVNLIQIIMNIVSIIWLIGVIILILYSIISYVKVGNKLKTSILIRDNIFETDKINTPFVCGFVKPKIYIPAGLSESELSYILAHEQTHIRRLDYIIKPIAFFALIIHWFNPIIWLSFALMSKDMEMSCDESVLKELGRDIRVTYSNSLLSLSVKRSGFAMGSPLAFGESDIKSRIKNVLAYKKPAFWVSIAAIIGVSLLILVLTANPQSDQTVQKAYSEYNAEILIANKTPYVGNNSKVVALIDAMCLPKGITRDKVELQTSKTPYGITINLIMKDASEITVNNAISGDAFYKNSILMFALIDNVDIITCKIIDDTGRFDGAAYSFTYTREMVNELLGEDVRVYSDSADTLGRLIQRLEDLLFDIKPDTQNVENSKIESNIRIIMSSPLHSSNPNDYIKAHPNEYENILKMGDKALDYLLDQFKKSNKNNDLRGHIMMRLCKEILGDSNNVKDEWLSPQEWFNKLSPYNETKLPDFLSNSLNSVEQIVYSASLKQYSIVDNGFTIVAPTIFGSYEEGNKLRVFVTVFSNRYRLYDKTLSEVGGSLVPAAITYTKNEDGSYELDEYLEAMDGAYWLKSIKEYCVMPVSKKEIKGLYDKIVEDYRSNNNRSELLMKNLVEHLKANNQKGVVLKRITGEIVPLT